MKNIINYFLEKPLIANAIFISIIILGFFSWPKIGKEEMPEFAMDWITVSISYPGATAKEVEEFIIKPIEDEIKSVQGIFEVNSTATQSSASISVNIDSKKYDQKIVIQDFKDAVLRVPLPTGVRNLPRFRQFNSSEKAIIDVGIFLQGKEVLDKEDREKLQEYALQLEAKLLNLKHISDITRKGYFPPEILITPQNTKLKNKEVTTSHIIQEIKQQHIDRPIGNLREDIEKKFAITNSLNSVDKLREVPLRANFSGRVLNLKDVATVTKNFVETPAIFKINGHQGIVLNIKKSPSADILTARSAVIKKIDDFKKIFEKSGVRIALMDDESTDVRNRLGLIVSNGATGFILIIIVLFFALNFKTAFWVSMGIPFSLAFTLVIAYLTGQTVNNITLAGIIIVLGIVVDDAIIIADNIKEKYESGLRGIDALREGVLEVVSPIAASVLTTILAFIPLMYFDGYFGLFIKYIPLIVFLMLMGSLLESYFILPGHLKLSKKNEKQVKRKKIFIKVEAAYKRYLEVLIKHKYLTLSSIIFLLIFIANYFVENTKFMMFPNEDVKEVFIKVKTPENSDRRATAKLIRDTEKFILQNKDTVAVRTTIANSRRGREVKQNQAWLRVEVKNLLERKSEIKDTISKWEDFIKKEKQDGKFIEAKVFKSWFGHGSGSPIEIMVRSEKDDDRLNAASSIREELKKIDGILNTDIEEPNLKDEYQITINQVEAKKLGISNSAIESTIRAATFSELLFSLRDDYQEYDVRVKVNISKNETIADLLSLSIPSQNGSSVSLSKLISIKKSKQENSIYRFDYKRTTRVFADFKPESSLTPLELADLLETKIFPKINTSLPSVTFLLKGEIEQSRKGISDFKWSIYMVVFSIFIVLVISFNNLISPLIVLSIIPFGLGSVCITLLLHGVKVYGFFSVIGAIGMIGVIVNDAIVMIEKLNSSNAKTPKEIIEISSSRIRAVLMTTITTVIGVLPTAYGLFGYDSMLSEMMLVMGWGLLFSTIVTLVIVPLIYQIFSFRKLR